MILGSILLGVILSMNVSNDIQNHNEITEMKKYVGAPHCAIVETVDEVEYETEPTTEYVEYNTSYFSEDEASLIALITMAEAEAEPVEGQRLVIDSILNRVDSDIFPNTVYDVVYQSGQFECVWNGRVDRCYVRDDIYQLVLEEMNSRYNYDVVFFRTEYYSEYGVPMFQVGNHFFSSYY
jgi:N-acetylmuramoyl-L-alanine amidase